MTTDKIFAKCHEHYIIVMMLVTRLFALVGGALVIYYVNLTFTLPPVMERDFSFSAMLAVVGAVVMSMLMALWETRALRRALRALRQGRTLEPALALRAGHEALTFPSRHTQHEALFDPCVTVLPVCAFLACQHDAPWALLLQVAIAGFLGISSVLLTTFFILEAWMPAVVRYLDDRGVALHFDAVPISHLHFRLNVCFGLTIVVTALMIGALANQRAMEIVRNPHRQAEAVASLRYHTSCIMIVAMCIGLFLSRMLASSIGSRAALLVDAMKRVQDGDLSQHVKPAGNDEIDLLARQFNAMVEQLSQNDHTIRDLYINLEHKVQQRTRQLSKSRKSLKRSLAKLREYDRVKTEFFSNVSHELRTPLTMILAPIGRILQKRAADLPADAVQTLRMVQLNGRRLLDLINRMLDFSKLEAGQMRLTLEPLDLNALIRDLAAAATPLATERGVRLELDCAESLPIFDADREKVDTVISNLVSNALKFTPAGGRIQVQTSSDNLHVRVSVRDSGVGIDPSHHRRIFERFVQVDGSCSRKFSGTGLGLALAKELVELHGGTIHVESALEQGSRFWCEFPLRSATANAPVREHQNPTQSVRFADLESGEQPEYQPSLPINGAAPAVLVVDDTPEIRGLVGEILLDAGYRVLYAGNGAEGLEIATRESPDLIISDVMMPVVDGYEFCRRIKQNPRTAHIPFVLLTAKAALAMKIDGLESGADDYLTKPFDEDELRARARSLVRLRRLHSDLDKRNHELATAYEDLRAMQSQLVQSEKMSSLGLLVAGLAHEINNSINAVYNGIQPLSLAAERLARMIDSLMPTLEAAGEAGFRGEVERHFRRIFTLAGVIENGASRTARIIHDLKTFSHPGNEEHREFDLHQTLDMCLNLLTNQIKHRIVIRRDYGTIPRAVGPTGQLNQVFMNLLNNAQQAIVGEGEIVLKTRQEGPWLSVSVRDSGPGIPPEVKEKIFDPFFTTKDPGVGTGLGLSLSYGIISKLGGKIECFSPPGQGAEFVVHFPCRPAAPNPAAAAIVVVPQGIAASNLGGATV